MTKTPCPSCDDLRRRLGEVEARVAEQAILIDALARAPAVHAYGQMGRADVQAARRRREAKPAAPTPAG